MFMPAKDVQRGESSLGRSEWWGLLLLLGVIVLMVWQRRPSAGEMPVPIGTAMPPLMAEGWLNIDQSSADLYPTVGTGIPSVESQRGKIVVIDCWATWCVPCRAAMPKLAKLYTQYRPLGVEFIGLTRENESDLPTIERFLRDYSEVKWPLGYGAAPTLDMLGVVKIPTLVVYGFDGRTVWSGHRLQDLSEALDQALAIP